MVAPVWLMDLQVQTGARGGLPGGAPASSPGGLDPGGGRCRGRRRALSIGPAVIAAGLRRSLSYSDIGVLIGRDKSVISREARQPRRGWLLLGTVAHRAAHE